jgi:hypothetical protein
VNLREAVFVKLVSNSISLACDISSWLTSELLSAASFVCWVRSFLTQSSRHSFYCRYPRQSHDPSQWFNSDTHHAVTIMPLESRYDSIPVSSHHTTLHDKNAYHQSFRHVRLKAGPVRTGARHSALARRQVDVVDLTDEDDCPMTGRAPA